MVFANHAETTFRDVDHARDPWGGLRKSGRAQLEKELGGIDKVGGIGGQGQQHQGPHVQIATDQSHQVGSVQGENQHAENIFPEEGPGKEVTPEDDLLPNGPRDHDGIQEQGLNDDGYGCHCLPRPRRQITQHQDEADQEDQKLHRRKNALDNRPG